MNSIFMKMAIKEALKAYDADDVPVGAIIVKDGKIIAKAHNKKQRTNIVTSHAEIIAIEKASKKLNDWRLNDCVMYVTLEPCLMCEGALIESRIDKVIYGTKNKKTQKNKNCKSIFEKSLSDNEKCEELLKTFFKSKRK